MKEYNLQGKVVRSTDLAGFVTTTGCVRRPFRHAHRIRKIANSATVHYSLLPIRYSDSTPSVVLCYDVMGRQVRAVDAAGVTTFAYDSFGSLTNETVIGVAGTNTIERFYDTFGRDAGYALNGVRQSTLSYDPATGRLAAMQVAGSDTPFTWSYLAGSDMKQSLAYPNGFTACWTYGNRGELLEVNNASPTGTISRYAYTYDTAGRRVACAKSGTAFEQSDSVNYGYNTRSELTNATAAVDSAYRYGYDFDDIGNRKTSSECGTNSVYTASQLNQYTAVDDFTPTYDADGNETIVKTATGIWNVTYNGENRPVLWTQGTNTISMSYDRMGRRVTKNDQRFVYDGYLQIANFHSTTTISNYNYFVWDPTEPIATRPLAWFTRTTNHQSPTTSFYTHDGNKNVSEVIASNNDVAAHYEYAPFGALTVSRGASAAANPWRFSSEYDEDETATVYYNYRHYEPVTGRWMSRDPIGDAFSNSLYRLLDNGQITKVDRLGLLSYNNKESCPGDCAADIDKIIKALSKTHLATTKNKKKILDLVKGGGWDDKSWNDLNKIGDKIRALLDGLRTGSGTTVECCYNDEACKKVHGEEPAAAYQRTSGERGTGTDTDVYSSLKGGTIYICDREKMKELGGCGCAIVHELLHKLGLLADEQEYINKNFRKDDAVVEITRILLQETELNCKGYDIK